MFHIFRTCWESPFDYGRPLGFEFHIITAEIVDWSELHQFEIGFWITTIVQTGPQNMIRVFIDVIRDSRNEKFFQYIISDLKHSMKEVGLPAETQENLWSNWGHSIHGNVLFMLQQMMCGLEWGDNHAKDHVLLLPASLHILGLAQRDSLIFGSYAHCPFQNSRLPSSKNT